MFDSLLRQLDIGRSISPRVRRRLGRIAREAGGFEPGEREPGGLESVVFDVESSFAHALARDRRARGIPLEYSGSAIAARFLRENAATLAGLGALVAAAGLLAFRNHRGGRISAAAPSSGEAGGDAGQPRTAA